MALTLTCWVPLYFFYQHVEQGGTQTPVAEVEIAPPLEAIEQTVIDSDPETSYYGANIQEMDGIDYQIIQGNHVFSVDINKFSIESSMPIGRKITAKQYLENYPGLLAVNGDMHRGADSVSPWCYTYDQGERVCTGEDTPSPSLIVYNNGTLDITHIEQPYPSNIAYAVSGIKTILTSESGQRIIPQDVINDHSQGNPRWDPGSRTLVGINDNTLYLVITKTMTFKTAGEFMASLGCHEAMAADSGWSSEFAFHNGDGIQYMSAYGGNELEPVANFFVVNNK